MIRTTARQLPRQLRICARQSTRPQSRFLSLTPRMLSAPLPPVQPPVSTALPSDSFQLLSTADKIGPAEDALFEEQVQAVKEWWGTPRYEGIKRPYSAEDVVSKRGALQQTYPSSIMARKLFNLLNERAASGEPVHTSESTLRVVQR
jgi:isocitrate lyase